MTHNDKHKRHTCDFKSETKCEHPIMASVQSGDKILVSKNIGLGNFLVLIVLIAGLIASWVRMEVNQEHTASAIQDNAEAIETNTASHKDILQEIRTSNRHVSQRVDRLLELELQSRRGSYQ